MMEQTIDGYSNYTVSPEGIVKNATTGKCLKPLLKNGYQTVQLKSNIDNSFKTLAIHRLVAMTYIGNSAQYKYVNHINGDKTDNRATNLEWVTQKMNVNHAQDIGLITPHTRSISQYDLSGNFLKEFDSVKDAAESVGVSRHAISAVCSGKNKTSAGFVWKYNVSKKTTIPSDAIVISDYPSYYVCRNGEVYGQTCVIKPQTNSNGYHYVTLCKNQTKKKNFYIHRLIANAFLENPCEKKFVNHKDLNKTNNHVDNLEWCSHSENVQHMYKHKIRNKPVSPKLL